MLRLGRLVNPKRITLARERRGYSKTDRARLLGVDIKTLLAYESGASSPTPAAVERISQLLSFPAEFFYGDDLDVPEPEFVSFRSLSRMTAKMRDVAKSQGALAIAFSVWLEKKFELPATNLTDLRLEAFEPEQAAASLRRHWGLGELPIRNMVHLLEANGVRVFSLAMDAKEVDAFSMWSGSVPFVLLNTLKSGERSRFDAAHELGHLVMHPHGGPSTSRTAESQTDAFASAFLMPEGSIRANAPRFATSDEIIRLRSIWGASAMAVAYRMHRLKILSDWHYHQIIVELSGRGYRRQEHGGIPRESSVLLPKLLSSLYEQDGLNRSAIARELAFPKSEVDNLLFGLTLSGIPGKRRGNPQLKRPSEFGPQLVN